MGFQFCEETIKQATDMYFERLMTQEEIAEKLGGPSQASISRWIRLDPRYNVASVNRSSAHPQQVVRAKENRIKYPYSVRLEAVRLANETNLSRSEIAKKLGISHAAIVTKWVTLARKKGTGVLMTTEDKKRILEESAKNPSEDVEQLKKENAQLKLENAILEQTIVVLKKDLSVDPRALSNREKALMVDALKNQFLLEDLLIRLSLPRSSYYYHKQNITAGDKYRDLRIRIKNIFQNSHQVRGYRYVWHELRCEENPIIVSEKVVRRIMKEENLHVIYHKRKRNYSSYKGEISKAPENLIERNFHADTPNKLWLTDITQFTLPNFKCYLSPILDCFDGKVVTHKISLHPNAELANSMLDDAITTLSREEHPVCHSDRGGHYRWPGWIQRCEKAGITRSMSKKGCSPDNSACEGFFGRLKNEFFYYRDWQNITYEEFTVLLNDYIDYYNEDRKKQSLGWLSPNQYRRKMGLAA